MSLSYDSARNMCQDQFAGALVCMRTHARTHTCAHAHTLIHTGIHTLTYARTRTCLHNQTRTRIIHTQIGTRITHIHRQSVRALLNNAAILHLYVYPDCRTLSLITAASTQWWTHSFLGNKPASAVVDQRWTK